MAEDAELRTDVLVIGAGGAGLYAAIEAARQGAQVLLLDRSLIGRGGATVMAQMTVAVALGTEQPDDPAFHLRDTLAAGRGLCDPALARLLCEEGVEVIQEMDAWKTGWARHADGRIRQAHAPGHDRPRCVYVDFLSTGPAVSRTLRTQAQRQGGIRRMGEMLVTDLVLADGRVQGAVALDLAHGRAVRIAAGATIIATGGLTRLYRRNSASANMAGDGYALALRAGATLIDMEFVQFFPIGHLAPRLIGMDPIMWDPFRYKLGGRLLNSEREEFTDRYGAPPEGGRYVVTRDLATYAITKEVAAGRGSPAGGAWLSFEHVPEAELRANFGPVIDRLAANGIDLTKTAIEVAPIAHYHMGGIRVDTRMATDLPGLFAAGEAVGGANGANRLSGNAITEALAFGRVAGRQASALAKQEGIAWTDPRAREALALAGRAGAVRPGFNPAAMFAALQATMAEEVGAFRTATGLARAATRIAALAAELGEAPPGAPLPHDLARADWFDLRAGLLVARAVVLAATARTESRGAHQREDHPGLDAAWTSNQTVTLAGGRLALGQQPVAAAA
ncbi:succinate dehydrogenase / fumarate reductase flavoprotein subunit/fumarate reductase flavoprotein subunit [Humitalea rosea]|uniref:Succinate dehydrogenase / fumarate reductase flavoprotein subunit/fumarate reductase flavoprotein subunit n=1 Tax=Humitalea rosea TaxID=990373 RepID=A0A2W7JFE4_9PROT|nr:FAD-binding protein [Humitalea rosea]PZW50498.1 succinate dehydrogenase / fumarate reductase flavoprotein subunit/fumarate reductase flavoprotein subunit [Humitalea rosea]